MHLCADDAYALGRLQDEDYTVPVWRRPGLLAVRMRRIDGAGGGGEPSCGRGADGGPPISPLGQDRDGLETLPRNIRGAGQRRG